ncbi:hypothetical protein LR48_Vigan03g128400 [Vigna angularis]|uniref:Disease resistance protein At4g27190-like leucine-rich repeats domain-containing protein n=1 Tax=Phaseolus angularis TaxID=3914 RepID=A0A0L9U5D9_PHAAN|nr:hypothetical protein LR48_Vigan03g128400 [Vigna angularis]
MLSLEKCTLGQNLSIIGELKKLRILTLSGSNIESLPFEFGQLDKLQLLDLSNCSKLSVIPSNVISRMNILEEFYMRDTLILWEAKEMIQNKNASLSELRHLNQLRNLDLHIQNVAHVPQNLFFDKLDSYKIIIGEFNMLIEGEFKIPDKYEVVKLLVLNLKEVCDCDYLKDIVSIERQPHTDSDDNIEFPQLRTLTLKSLPAFTSLYTNDKIPCSARSLEEKGRNRNRDIIVEVEQDGTNSCLSLFNEKILIPKLESLELSSVNIQKIWSDKSQHCFQNLLTLNVTDCGNLKYLLSFSMAVSLENLQSLSVSECEMMEDIFRPKDDEGNIDYVFPKLKKMEITCMEKLNSIWQPHIGLHSFNSLDSLIIRECHKLVKIFPSFMGQKFQSLQSLTITNCKLVENIFDFEMIPQTSDINETQLHKIVLQNLSNLVSIWKDDTCQILKYNNLQSITVAGSPNLNYLFPVSITKDLENLESLDVRNCRAMKEIVGWDKGTNENVITFKFPRLNYVSLQSLFELMSFYGRAHTLEWPSLKKLLILRCGKLEGINTDISNSQVKPIGLATEKVIYNLEFMAMSFREVEWLQNYIINVHRMQNLQSVVLHGLKNVEVLFWLLHRLPNLKRLTLGFCHLKRIWAPASLISREKIGVVMQLQALELKNIWPLEEIGFEHEVLLQRVERLIIQCCTKLKILASSSVSFSYLTYLEVENCMLRNLMTCSTAKTLVQLKTMKVSYCPMIVEIISENEGEEIQEIEFKLLRSLELVSLQNLTSFMNVDKCDLKFPVMENLVVSECPKMTKFSKVQSAPNLQKVQVVATEKDKWYWEGDLNATLKKHFTHQVSFEYSKHMKLKDYPEMKEVCQGKPVFQDNFFGSLRKLEFDAASKREIVLPSYVLPYLKNLEELNIESCKSARVIFDMDDCQIKETVFRLKKLTLKDLPNMKWIWNKNPEGIVSFPNLEEVFVSSCGTLVTLFPSTLARNLSKLKALTIHNCSKLVEIVEKKEEMEDEITEIFEFPCLSKLFLCNLPMLICFYPRQHLLKCPILERLHVAYCRKLKLFTSQPHHSLPHPMFLIEEVVPKLKEVILNEKNITLLKDGHSRDLLHKLNYLDLVSEDYGNKKDSLPFDFLQKVPNLEYLVVRQCFGLKEIFPSKKLDGDHDGILLAGLNKLSLNKLLELESIGLDHPWVKPYTEKLQGLAVIKCPRLERLVNCVTSFINLKQLIVKNCKRMMYLFTFSTAKSLGKLETLRIENCESMKEIIEKEDENGYDEIIFGRLTKLWLYSLPRLVSFYSGNDILQFSSLQIMRLFKCPNMKSFSQGNTNAPMFYGIKSSSDSDLTFHSDLNMTVESLFHEQGFFEYSKQMILLDYLEMRGFGPVKDVFPRKFFGSLKKLEVDGASKGDTVIPSNVLSHLKSLEELNVHSSDEVQVIFGMDHNSRAKSKETVFHLKKLSLKDLSNLKCILNKNLQGSVSFPNLQELFVDGCGSLVTLFARKLQTLEMQKSDKLVEIVGNEDATTETLVFEFPCLSSLTLYNLTHLSCFYPGKHHLECPQLEILHVAYCPKLNLFTSKIHDSHKETAVEAPINWLQQPLFMVEKVVPKLRGLTLNEKNMMLLSNEHVPEVNLTKLNLLRLCFEDDKNEKDTLPFEFMNKVLNLEHLRVQRCFGVKEIFPSQKLQVHDGIPASLNGLTLFELNELESIGFEHPWLSTKMPFLLCTKPFPHETLVLCINPELETVGGVLCSHPCRDCRCGFGLSTFSFNHDVVGREASLEFNPSGTTIWWVVKASWFVDVSVRRKLQTLEMQKSDKLVEIVGNEDATTETLVFEFPCLSSLTLYNLTHLSCFYPGKHHLECPQLEILHVAYCPKLNLFTSKIHDSHKETAVEAPINWLQQPLFMVEKVVPKLRGLTLNEKNMMLLSNEHVPEVNLTKLNLLRLCFEDDKNEKDTLPFEFMNKVLNLEHLRVQRCFGVKEIFPSQKLQVHDGIPASLNGLTLFELNELESIGFEHPWLSTKMPFLLCTKPFPHETLVLCINPELETVGGVLCSHPCRDCRCGFGLSTFSFNHDVVGREASLEFNPSGTTIWWVVKASWFVDVSVRR